LQGLLLGTRLFGVFTWRGLASAAAGDAAVRSSYVERACKRCCWGRGCLECLRGEGLQALLLGTRLCLELSCDGRGRASVCGAAREGPQARSAAGEKKVPGALLCGERGPPRRVCGRSAVWEDRAPLLGELRSSPDACAVRPCSGCAPLLRLCASAQAACLCSGCAPLCRLRSSPCKRWFGL